MISLVVPTAGLFRHNERLWPEILAASLKTRVELVLVCQDPPSPRLFARLGGQGFFGARAHLTQFDDALDMAKSKNKDGVWIYHDDQYLIQPEIHYVR